MRKDARDPQLEGEPGAREAEARRPRLQRVNRQQLRLQVVDVEQLVGPEHPVRAIWEFVGRLDLSRFYQTIEAVEGVAGRPSFDPRLLISVWIYAYSEGVGSAREVARLCTFAPPYQWLTGCQPINYHTLADFRVAHQAALDELFTQVLGVLSAEGLITLERVMHDGTKVQAAAGHGSFHREATLRAHWEAARERVQALGDPHAEPRSRATAAQVRAAHEQVERLERALGVLQQVQATAATPAERRVSETDPDARIMKRGDGGYGPSYNVQLSTDAAHSLLVGVRVTTAVNDQGQLVPALAAVEKNLGRLPQQVVADGAFTSRETVVQLAAMGVDYIGGAWAEPPPRDRGGPEPPVTVEAFHYDAATNTYTCPQGRTLRYRWLQRGRVGKLGHVYVAAAADCAGCPLRARCCQSQSTGKHGRMIVRAEYTPVVAAFLAKMETAAAKAIYHLRGAVAEFPNAWLKAKIGLRRFSVRGMQKVRLETLWACLTYNLQQWIRLCWRGRLAQKGV
jgi:transposase